MHKINYISLTSLILISLSQNCSDLLEQELSEGMTLINEIDAETAIFQRAVIKMLITDTITKYIMHTPNLKLINRTFSLVARIQFRIWKLSITAVDSRRNFSLLNWSFLQHLFHLLFNRLTTSQFYFYLSFKYSWKMVKCIHPPSSFFLFLFVTKWQ